MKLLTIILTVFQVMVMCCLSYSLGYSKGKLPKKILDASIFILILNTVLLIINISKL